MKHGSEVVGKHLFNYTGYKYHVVDDGFRLYLCDCMICYPWMEYGYRGRIRGAIRKTKRQQEREDNLNIC